MIEAERCINGKISLERRFYISSRPADALHLAQAVRARWAVENSPCIGVWMWPSPMPSFSDWHDVHAIALSEVVVNRF